MTKKMKFLTRMPSWVIYPLGIAPAVYLFWAAVNNQLGADPLASLENELGEWALKFLIIGLCITPLMRFGRINLVKYRRAIGLVAFAYVFLHLAVYLFLDRQLDWWAIWKDVIKRPYITIGVAAFLMLLPLAFTSNNYSVKRLGSAAWRNLHRLVYPAALFGAVHFVLLEKVWEPEALSYMAIIVVLIALRFLWLRKAKRPVTN